MPDQSNPKPDAMGLKLIGHPPSKRVLRQSEANGVNSWRVPEQPEAIQPDENGQFPLATAAREVYLRQFDDQHRRSIMHDIRHSDQAAVQEHLDKYNELAKLTRGQQPPPGVVIDGSMRDKNIGETYRQYNFDAPTLDQLAQMSGSGHFIGPSPYETPQPTISMRVHAAAPAETTLHEQLHVRQATAEAPRGTSPRGRELFKIYNATRDPHEIHRATGMPEFARESDYLRTRSADDAVAELKRKLGMK